jgi:DNA repair exonuclease SbcCD nuclease subunit
MKKIKLIIHCADIHIRLNQRMEEYVSIFEKFINNCKEITSKYNKEEVRIVISGDLLHSKNQLSPNLITITSYFLRQLEEIAKVIVIAGNHDLIVENKEKTDSITALFDTANFDNCIFLDAELDYKSGCAIDNNVVWCLYSIYEDFLRPTNIEELKESHPNNKFIGLFHGQVIGSTLNNGYVSDSGLDGDAFEGCDCVMAGHLHKRQVLKRGDTEIVYPGSLIQQTYGETVSQHGFAVWNIENMTYEFVDIDSDYGLYDVDINSIDDIDEDKERLVNF